MFIGQLKHGVNLSVSVKDFEGEATIYQATVQRSLRKSKHTCRVKFRGALPDTTDTENCIEVSAESEHLRYVWKDVELTKRDSTSFSIKTEFKAECFDRRAAVRIPLHSQGYLAKITQQRTEEFEIILKDVSATGVGFICEKTIGVVGDKFRICWVDKSLKLNVECVVSLVRSRVLELGGIEYGAVIENCSPSAEDYVRLKIQEIYL